MGHLESLIGGGYQLTGLMGELRDDSNPNIGVLTVLDGTITDDGVSGSPYAHGTITYNLTGSFGPDVSRRGIHLFDE